MAERLRRRLMKLIGFIGFYVIGGDWGARIQGVTVGKHSRIYIRDFGSEPNLISIGSNVTITKGCVLLTHDGSRILVRDRDGNRTFKYGAIRIADNVFLGTNSIIMPGIEICLMLLSDVVL